MEKTVPALLAPAGGMRSLKTALRFGADAVYLGAKRYGLRSQADNFDEEELEQAVALAHACGAEIHLTLNRFARDGDLPGMARMARLAQEMGVDAAIVSDMGAIARIRREAPGLRVHVSTQANAMNAETARVYASLGATRVVLARELTMEDIERMARALSGEIELESFVHGAMCVAYSGRCLLSAALTGRSGNAGACAQPCRWVYELREAERPEMPLTAVEDGQGTYVLSAYDLCMLGHLPRLMRSGVDCLKIEGRMKNELYVATVTGAYRRAMDAIARDPQAYAQDEALQGQLHAELHKISHRPYDTGFYFGPPVHGGGAPGVTQEAEYVAYVLDVSGGEALVEMKNRFFEGDALEAVTPAGPRPLTVEGIRLEATGERVRCVNVPRMLARIPCPPWLEAGDLLRGPVRNLKNQA